MKSEYQLLIIDKIRRLRHEHDYSQFKLAALLGISAGQMGNIESPMRAHKYTLSQLSVVCEEFGMPIEKLFLDNTDSLAKEEIIRRLINSIIEYEKQ